MYEPLSESRFQKLGYFEAQCEVEAPAKGNGFRQVCSPESRWTDLEERLIDPRAVNPDDVVHAVRRELREPGAEPAPDVHDAAWGYFVDHERHENTC